MRIYFKFDGLSSQHQDDLMIIESIMAPRSTYAVFEIKACDLKTNHDLEGAYEHFKKKLSGLPQNNLG